MQVLGLMSPYLLANFPLVGCRYRRPDRTVRPRRNKRPFDIGRLQVLPRPIESSTSNTHDPLLLSSFARFL